MYQASDAITSTANLFSHSFAHVGSRMSGFADVCHVNRYTFSGSVSGKYQQAIIDCVAMTGFMSLKNSDHAVSGHNAAANKRILKEAIETRKAADVLLASGAITLMGTWSNGIQVGPGEGFARIERTEPAAVAAPVKSARKPRTYADGLDKQWHDDARRFPAIVQPGATCEMRYADGACCPVSIRKAAETVVSGEWVEAVSAPLGGISKPSRATLPIAYDLYENPDGTWRIDTKQNGLVLATNDCPDLDTAEKMLINLRYGVQEPAPLYGPAYVAPLTPSKPRVRVTLAQMRVAAMPAQDDADALIDAAITAITGEEYSESAIAPAPVPTPIYEPVAGETIHFMLAHENGTTTERVVIVHRVRRDSAGNVDMFRGFDIRRNKARNFEMARVQWMRQWDGKEITDMTGRVLVPAA